MQSSEIELNAVPAPGPDAGDGGGDAVAPLRRRRKPLFRAPRRDWRDALVFMLSMSALGLKFYPALLLVIVLMVRSWRTDRYHFLLQLILFSTWDAFLSADLLIIHRTDLMLMAGAVGLFAVRRNTPELKKVFWMFLAYVGLTLAIASLSVEELSVQIRLMRNYFSFVVYTIPLMMFARRRFKAGRFFQIVGVYSVLMCLFYVLDGFVIRGWFLLPATYCPYGESTFYNPIFNPFNLTYFPRKYPNGLLMLMLMIYPLHNFFRFGWKQWTLVGLAFAATRTMTVIGSLVITYVLFIGRGRKIVLAIVAALALLPALYVADTAMGGFMRISSTIDQFAMLKVAEDREDLAEFGSTRMAQIIPKMEMLYERNLEWTGFGFIHPELSKGNAFQLTNDLYSDIEKSDENVTGVEENHIQTILQVGYLGLILQTLFYLSLYWVLKPCRLRAVYLIAFIANTIYAIGGFGGLDATAGLVLQAFAFAVVVLDHKRVTLDELDEARKVQPVKTDD